MSNDKTLWPGDSMNSILPPSQRQEVRAFWTGPKLSLYEELSLNSFVAAGARVQLFTYERDLAVPDGVELVNANELLPGPVHQFRHASGDKSLALHSDLFRYVAIEKFGGWYVDVDIVCIGKELPTSPAYIARETEKVINGAVMKFPAQSPLLIEAIKEARRLLPQTGMASTHEARLMIGPPLMTRLIGEFALDHVVRPRSSAYEIGYDEIPSFFDPASCERLQERVADSDFTHLWNEVWRWVRIPKNYGPPEGSFLDSLFRRFGMIISPQARLSYGAITDWFREHRLLQDIKYRLGDDRLPADSMDQLTGWFKKTFGWQDVAAVDEVAPAPPAEADLPAVATVAKAPQVLQTFWHGEAIGSYQLLCLRSFADRGHQMEVFSYDSDLHLPGWIERRDAAEVLPREQVLRRLGKGRTAINANLFRYALLHQRGGWWIDPDIVLLRPELPSEPVFFAGPDIFKFTSTGVLRFPKGHPVMKAALDAALSLQDAVPQWERAGAGLLTDLILQNGLGSEFRRRGALGPVSWFDVPDLFDPAKRADIERSCQSADFLQLHDDVWRRAGVPHRLGPPEGSALDQLFQQHGLAEWFNERIDFGELNRWITHMYEAVSIRQKLTP
jgi:Glycosyltransferase sugar-binding region containing DXD motif